MKALLFTGLLAAALALGAAQLAGATATPAAPDRTAWTSEWFHSPTHNIHCRWFWTAGLMACITENNGRMVTVTRYGQPAMRWGTGGRSFPAGPTLYYGENWTGWDVNDDSAIRCWSRSTGMTCKSLFTGRGFWIAKEGYRLLY